MEKDEVMLTTINNPFNPFTEFENWLSFDFISGTNCCGALAKVAKCSNALSDEVNDQEIERAMDSIVDAIPTLYVKLHKSTADKTIKEMQDKLISVQETQAV